MGYVDLESTVTSEQGAEPLDRILSCESIEAKKCADQIIDRGDIKSVRSSALRICLILRAIRRNLQDPDFDLVTLAQELGASRATIYRELKGLGGFRSLVFTQRLEIARSRLRSTRGGYGVISSVAYACGFKSPQHFSRAYQRKFGVTPSEEVKNQRLRRLQS